MRSKVIYIYINISSPELKDRRGHSHLKEESLDCTMWKNRFGGGFEPVVRQNTERIYVYIYIYISGKWKLHGVHGNVDMVHRACFTVFMPYFSHDDYDDSDKYKSKTCVRLYMLTAR